MMTTYRYLSRAEWGGTWKDDTPPVEVLFDPEVYVHHVGGSAWMNDDAVRVFRELNAYAKNVKGYEFLDYDLLVHYSRSTDTVTIGEGRGAYRSAATLDRNEQGEAVCVCGNYDLRQPTAEEIEGTARAIVVGINEGWIAKGATILGHRDNPAHPNATACPGRYLYAELPRIRTRVAELVAPPTPTPPPTPVPPAPPKVSGPIGVLDMVLLAHESGKDTFWMSPNGGVTRYPVRSMDHVRSIVNVGCVDAVTGARLTGSNWHTASVLPVAGLNDRLGAVG